MAINSQPPLAILPATCLEHVCSYLPLSGLVQTLRTSKVLRKASRGFCHAALLDGIPLSEAMFLAMPAESNRGSKFDANPPYEDLKFVCENCETVNNITRDICVRCGMENQEGNGLRRMFIGQLRKTATTEITEWMLAMIFPKLKPYHIESHTTKLGRSKGCAWVYISGSEFEENILSLHGKIFIDVDDEGREGLWYCKDSSLLLALYNERRGDAIEKAKENTPEGQEPPVPAFPRMPLVCERPTGRQRRGTPNPEGFLLSSAPTSVPSRPLSAVSPALVEIEVEEPEEDPYERFAPRRRSGSGLGVRCDSLRSNSTFLSSYGGTPTALQSSRNFAATPELSSLPASMPSYDDDNSGSERSSRLSIPIPAVPSKVVPANVTPTRAHQEGHFAWAETNYRRMMQRAKDDNKFTHDPYNWSALFSSSKTKKK